MMELVQVGGQKRSGEMKVTSVKREARFVNLCSMSMQSKGQPRTKLLVDEKKRHVCQNVWKTVIFINLFS